MRSSPGLRGERGFTLVEILVAAAVFGIGLLGVASLQLNTLRLNREAYQVSQASLMAQDLLTRMELNPVEARAGGYDISFGAVPASGSVCHGGAVSCSGTEMRRYDLGQWFQALARAIPGAEAEVEVTLSNNDPFPPLAVATVRVRWQAQADAPPQIIELASRLPAGV